MNLLKKLSLFSALIIAFTGLNTCAMGQFARKAFPKACTVLYGGILGAQCVGIVFNNLNEESEKRTHLYPAKPEVVEFAQNEFKKIGVTQPAQIKVHYETRAFKDFVVLNMDEQALLRQLLETKEFLEANPSTANAQSNLKFINEELLKLQFTFQHEGGHIKHNHFYKGIAATAAMPVALHFSLKGLKKIVSPLSQPTLLKSALKIPAAFACIIASELISQHLIYRPGEQQADNGVTDDKELLIAASTHMKESHAQATAQIKAKDWFKKYFATASDAQVEKIMSVHYALFDTHPHPLRRAQKFEQRVKKLEEQA